MYWKSCQRMRIEGMDCLLVCKAELRSDVLLCNHTHEHARICRPTNLLAQERNSFSFSSDRFDWKDHLISCSWWGKPRVRLVACELTLPPVDLQTNLSFTCDTRLTFFPSAACKQRTCSPKSRTWCKTVSPLAAAYIKNTKYLSPTTKNTEFECINHRKRLVHFNVLFGRCDCSLIVQEDISLLQSCCVKPPK